MSNVSFSNVTAKYGKNTIFSNLSLEVKKGEIMCLVGPSGCGKTTLVRCLLGLHRPETGRIAIGDTVLFDAEKRINVPVEKRKIGIVFQDYAVWPHMTVLENVMYPLKKRKYKKEMIKDRAMHALEQVHMTKYESHLPSQLSGGQQQRVAIARALVTGAEVVVMDEPITNLDAKLREEMLLEIRMIQNNLGATILYITHDQQSALELCDRLAVMQLDGKICQVGTDEEIITNPVNRFTFEFIGNSNAIPMVVDENKPCFELEANIPAEGVDIGNENVDGKDMLVRLNDVVFDNSSPIKAEVTSRIFLGSEYNYFLNLYGKEIRLQQSMLDAKNNGIANVGETVGIKFINPHFYKKLMNKEGK